MTDVTLTPHQEDHRKMMEKLDELNQITFLHLQLSQRVNAKTNWILGLVLAWMLFMLFSLFSS